MGQNNPFMSHFAGSIQMNPSSEYDDEGGDEKEINDLREAGVTYQPGAQGDRPATQSEDGSTSSSASGNVSGNFGPSREDEELRGIRQDIAQSQRKIDALTDQNGEPLPGRVNDVNVERRAIERLEDSAQFQREMMAQRESPEAEANRKGQAALAAHAEAAQYDPNAPKVTVTEDGTGVIRAEARRPTEEDQAAAYYEQQQQQGQQQAQQNAPSDYPDPAAQGSSNDTISAAKQEFAAKGALAESTYRALERHGISRELVDAQIEIAKNS